MVIELLQEVFKNIPPEVMTLIGMTIVAIFAFLIGDKRKAEQQVIDIESFVRETLDAKGLPQPTSTEVDVEFIQTALEGELKSMENVKTVFTDEIYFAVDKEELNELRLVSSLVQFFPYRPERFDCENFAGRFRNDAAFIAGINAIGTVHDWSSGHAYNTIITSDGDALFYNPQDNKMVEIGESEKYKLEDALVIF